MTDNENENPDEAFGRLIADSVKPSSLASQLKARYEQPEQPGHRNVFDEINTELNQQQQERNQR